MTMSVLECDLMKDIQVSYESNMEAKAVIEELKNNSAVKKHNSWVQNIFRRKSKIDVPMNISLNSILQWLHCSSSGGHSGRDAMHQRVK